MCAEARDVVMTNSNRRKLGEGRERVYQFSMGQQRKFPGWPCGRGAVVLLTQISSLMFTTKSVKLLVMAVFPDVRYI